MEGRDFGHIQRRYRDMYKPALLANWEVWPVAQVGDAPTSKELEVLKHTSPAAHQFQVYAPALSRANPVHLRRVLDVVFVPLER